MDKWRDFQMDRILIPLAQPFTVEKTWIDNPSESYETYIYSTRRRRRRRTNKLISQPILCVWISGQRQYAKQSTGMIKLKWPTMNRWIKSSIKPSLCFVGSGFFSAGFLSLGGARRRPNTHHFSIFACLSCTDYDFIWVCATCYCQSSLGFISFNFINAYNRVCPISALPVVYLKS